MSVVQALAGCGESCGLHVLFGESCAISACWAGQLCPKYLVNVVSDSKTMVGWSLAEICV